MSMFWCHECGAMRDSDDGCEAYSDNKLICSPCADELDQAKGDAAESKLASTARPEGTPNPYPLWLQQDLRGRR